MTTCFGDKYRGKRIVGTYELLIDMQFKIVKVYCDRVGLSSKEDLIVNIVLGLASSNGDESRMLQKGRIMMIEHYLLWR